VAHTQAMPTVALDIISVQLSNYLSLILTHTVGLGTLNPAHSPRRESSTLLELCLDCDQPACVTRLGRMSLHMSLALLSTATQADSPTREIGTVYSVFSWLKPHYRAVALLRKASGAKLPLHLPTCS
jgi:hypothetical protein